MLDMEGVAGKDTPVTVKGGFSGPYIEGQAAAELAVGSKNGTPEATLSGKLGGGVYLAEAKVDGVVTLTPWRGYNYLVVSPYNRVAEWAGWTSRLRDLDKNWDWGFYFGGEAKANIGAGAEVKAKAKLYPPSAEITAKGAIGVGAGVGAKLGVQTPEGP